MSVIAHSIYVCDICGQRLAGPESRCNSGLHQGPDDPNGWRGKAVEYLPAAACRGAVDDAATGRALIDRMFELPRPSPEWEQALAELRVWCMDPARLGGQ